MKINIVSQIDGVTGFSQHGRQLALALDKAGADVGIETQLSSPNWQREMPEPLRKLVMRDYRENAIQILNTFPPYAYTKSGDGNPIYQYCIFEGTKIPSGWAIALKEPFITKVLVPSTHTFKACIAAGVPAEKITIVPHGYNPETFNPEGKLFLEEFVFVWNKGWALGEKDRSNLGLFLRAFTEEFKGDEKVKAIVKINPIYAKIDYAGAIKALNLQGNARNKLLVNSEVLSNNNIADLYRSGDVFVSTSRGESFNLPCLEAMACGTPVIAPFFGGHADYIEDGKTGFIIYAGKYIVPGDENPIYEEAKWFEASQGELQAKMRYCFEHREEIRKMGALASKYVGSYTWSDTAKKIMSLMK